MGTSVITRRMMMILTSLIQAEAAKKEFGQYHNDRAAAVLCTEFAKTGCSYIQQHVTFEVDTVEYKRVAEYIRLCPELIADPLLDYAADVDCGTMADCYEGCKNAYGDECAQKNMKYEPPYSHALGECDYWFDDTHFKPLVDIWSAFKDSEIPEERRRQHEMSLSKFMETQVNGDNENWVDNIFKYAPENHDALPQDVQCCDDDRFLMRDKDTCGDIVVDLSTNDADANYYFTGRYEKDLVNDDYTFPASPDARKYGGANEFLGDMWEDYDQDARLYNGDAMLTFVDTSGEGKFSDTPVCRLVDITHRADGSPCAARENFCVSNTVRGALTRRHCPETCSKKIVNGPMQWSPASYHNCRRWCKQKPTTETPTETPSTAETTDSTEEITTEEPSSKTTEEPSSKPTEPTTEEPSSKPTEPTEPTEPTTEAEEESNNATTIAFASASAAGVGAAAIGGGIYAASGSGASVDIPQDIQHDVEIDEEIQEREAFIDTTGNDFL